MMSAFRAVYSNFKNIPTRKCVQIVFEIPVEQFNDAMAVLGGAPDPSVSKWFGIAPLVPDQPQPEKDKPPAGAKQKKDWRDLPPAQQAGIRCEEPIFQAFLKETRPSYWRQAKGDAAEAVRLICAVESRSQLNEGAHRGIWSQLDSAFQTWKMMENA